MELETAVRHSLPVVNIIVNNHALGMERRGYIDYAGEVPPAPVSFSPQDFSKIAQAFNCFGARAESPGDIRGAIAAALASGQPAIVDVLTIPRIVTPRGRDPGDPINDSGGAWAVPFPFSAPLPFSM